jgi:hypothetical protein
MLAISPPHSGSAVSGSAQPAEMNLRRLIVDWSDTVMPRRCSILLLRRAGRAGHHLIYPHHKTIRSYCCNCDTRDQHGGHQQERNDFVPKAPNSPFDKTKFFESLVDLHQKRKILENTIATSGRDQIPRLA